MQETGMVVPAFGDRVLARGFRYGRVIAIGAAGATDSVYVSGNVTTTYGP